MFHQVFIFTICISQCKLCLLLLLLYTIHTVTVVASHQVKTSHDICEVSP